MDNLAEKAYDLTSYRYAMNNPVRIFDKDGNDDFFDINGNFVKRVNNNSSDVIMNGKKLSTVNFTGNLESISKVITHYHKQLVKASPLRNGKITVYNAILTRQRYSERYNSRDDRVTSGYSITTMMNGASKNYYSNGDANEIRFNLNKGKSSPVWDDYNNIISALIHEDRHIKQGMTRDEYKKKFGEYELDAYIYQFTDESFEKSSFKKDMISNALRYVNTGLDTGHTMYVEKLNNALNNYGSIEYNYKESKYEFQYKK